MTLTVFENEFGTVYPDPLRFPAVPGDAVVLNGETVPLSAVRRVGWLYDVYARVQAAPLSKLQIWISALVSLNLLLMPIVVWWGVSRRKWRVVVTLKSGSFVRSAHLDKWAKADAFAKAARQAARKLG